MARLPYLEKADVAPEHHDMLEPLVTLHQALIHSPEVLRAMLGVGRHIRHRSQLAARLRELAIFQIAYITQAPYVWSHHLKRLAEDGVSDADMRALEDETAGRPTTLDALTKAVLRAAREMTTELAVTDETFAVLKQHLDSATVVDLVVCIGHYNSLVRITKTLQIDVEDRYQIYLHQYPLPT
ncbi:MAG TPA: carboxymuconolactone decarboxylase family protein [Stellaceae bacterium]|jgi:alkylhydroperoxidase family enzyme|nr:carboxymuconolactone decarboxylase family protein [Stellaceae bacterium]